MNSNTNRSFEEALKEAENLLVFKTKEEKLEFDADGIQLDIMHEVQKLMDKEGGMSRKQLADKLGKSKSFVSQLFSCDKKLHLGLLAQLQDIFQAKFIPSFKLYSEFQKEVNMENYKFDYEESIYRIFSLSIIDKLSKNYYSKVA